MRVDRAVTGSLRCQRASSLLAPAAPLKELRAANGQVEIVGHVQSVDDAQAALRDLSHHEGLCSIPALRRASPATAIVLPPAGEPGPRVVRAVRIASAIATSRRGDPRMRARVVKVA